MKKLIAVFLLGCSMGLVGHLFAQHEGYQGVDAIIINGKEYRGKVEFRGSTSTYISAFKQDDGTNVIQFIDIPKTADEK